MLKKKSPSFSMQRKFVIKSHQNACRESQGSDLNKETLPQLVNLLGYTRSQLVDFFAEIGERSYRAEQVMKWIHQHGVTDFSLMNNLSKSLREQLSKRAHLDILPCVKEQKSHDGTIKW